MKIIYILFLSTFFLFSTTNLLAKKLTIDTKELLNSHNKLRKNYHSPALIYSQKLEHAAQKWANKLQKDGCKMVHSHGKVGPYGENIFWASPLTITQTSSSGTQKRSTKLQKIKAKSVSQAWYDEVRWYNFATNSCKQGEMCGHYTQLIWDTTRKLGCAAASCDDKSQVWVCEYFPAGNVSLIHSDGKVEKLKPYKKVKNDR